MFIQDNVVFMVDFSKELTPHVGEINAVVPSRGKDGYSKKTVDKMIDLIRKNGRIEESYISDAGIDSYK